ncbi:MAG: hypothetical protein WC308_03220 [archaeon]|jgi:hypothetical protein
MAESRRESREVLIGIVAVIAAAYFMLSAMQIVDIPYRMFAEDWSIILAVFFVGIGVYLLTKNTSN